MYGIDKSAAFSAATAAQQGVCAHCAYSRSAHWGLQAQIESYKRIARSMPLTEELQHDIVGDPVPIIPGVCVCVCV